jgi:hypothetical protein
MFEGQLLLLFVFGVTWYYYFGCLWLAVFVVPALGNGPVFVLENACDVKYLWTEY